MPMTFGSLFAGIGGLDLGLERSGMVCKWQVEYDDYCIKVLEKHWPEVKRYGDITKIDKGELEQVDLICGGFPCQPFSVAGQRKGTDDERWLWPEFRDTIRQVRPEWVLVENVPGLLSIDSGKIFAGILRELAEMGFDAWWGSLRASDVGANHRRERVFIVANTESGEPGKQAEQKGRKDTGGGSEKERNVPDPDQGGRPPLKYARGSTTEDSRRKGNSEPGCSDVAHAGSEESRGLSGIRREEMAEVRGGSSDISNSKGRDEPRLLQVKSGQSGTSTKGEATGGHSGDRIWDNWTTEPNVVRVAHGIPSRVDRLKCLGNAVVPQVAEFIGRAIMEATR